MVSPQNDDEQFDFYLKFAKPLVLNLSDTNDRIKAAAWIRKLKDEADNTALRTDYLKLLLFVLQRRKLIGPFAVIPDDARPLQPFPEEINLQDVAKNFVEIDKKVLKDAIEKGGFGEWPPYNVACSSDLKEYAASQDIPNFGVHVYFAISKDPINNWEQNNKAIFPIGEKMETSNDFGLSTNISPNISSFVPQEQTSLTPEKSPKKDEGGDGPPPPPSLTDRKDILPSSSDPYDVDENITPTWGSNLMKVNDDVLAEDFSEEDFDFNVSNRDMLDLNDENIDLDEVEGISDLEDSFYLEGDKLLSPVRTPCSSPAPSLPYKTPPVPSVNLPSPAPSLPYRSPPVPTVNLPSPAPSLPYKTPPIPRTPKDFLFDISDVDNENMLDYTDQSINLIEDDDMFFDGAAMYLQSDRLESPVNNKPCEPCESISPKDQTLSPVPNKTPPIQGRIQASPAPSLPYRTPPIPTVNLPSPAPSLPYRTPPKPGTPCDCSSDKADMLDYMDESMELVEDISFDDAAMYLKMDRLTTPPKHQPYQPCGSSSPAIPSPAPSVPYKSPPMPQSPQSETPSRMHPQPCQPCGSSPQYRPTLERSEEEQLKRLEREIFDEIQTNDMDRVQSPDNVKNMGQLENQTHTRGQDLGGDSFIAPESKDFRWLQSVSPGPGLPEDTEQDPNLWESFGWWTDNPDEIFEYLPPSPRVCGSPDPYAEERERWADVPATPPIFSRDPEIQTGPGAQRIYAIEEFGMESFEEPVWTSASQYLRYMPDSPYQDPRDINRQTLDIAQYNKCAEMNKEIFDIEGEAGSEYFFTEEQPPIDDLEVSFQEQDFQKMTRAQAAFEAMQHGPVHIGAPPSPPPPTPEDQIQLEEAMTDVDFLAKTPPKFVFQPQFSSTPPIYHPNTSINADDLDETISKYIEDEIKIIQSNIPVTTPQRSPSPKRKKRFIGNESLPNIEDVVLDDENIVSSPELKTPPRHHVSPRRDINWDTEIGEPRKISPLKSAYLGIPDDERLAKSAKRKKELVAMYREQQASPPLVQSPIRPAHLIDEPIPSDLRSPLPPKKLPPHGWSWQSPPTAPISSYNPRIIKTPTGLTPPKKMPEEVTMFYESPPHEIYSPPPSPSSAVGALQFSPPSRFDSPPSPVRSPGGRPIFANWQPAEITDDIDMAEMFPIYDDFIVEENPDLYTSPERLKSPEVLKELDKRTVNLSPTSKKKFYDAEIEALENEVFNAPSTPCGSSSRQQSPGSPITPEYERRIWRENLRLHDVTDYWKRQWVVRPKPGKTKAIKRFTVGSRLGMIPDQEEPSSSPKLQKSKLPASTLRTNNEQHLPAIETITNIEADLEKLRRSEEEAMQRARQREADRKRKVDQQLMEDMADLTKLRFRTPPIDTIERDINEVKEWCRRKELGEIIRQRLQAQFASPPRPCITPVVHPFDEPLPEESELPPALLPPSGWTWKTPPKYKFTDYKPCKKRTPTGIESPEKMSEDVTMFFESPPHELLSPSSPCAASSALQYTPTCGFNIPSSPIRSPGGRPITESWQIDNIVDEIDLDKVYPAQFEDIYEEEIPELYMSPPKVYEDNINQEINVTIPKSPYKQSSATQRITNRPLSPVTPEQERQIWKEKLKLHELHEYWKKQWTVRPKPGKTRKVKRFTSRPALHTIPDEREQLRNQPCQDEEILKYAALIDAEIAEINRRMQAEEEVLRDIADLPQIQTFNPTRIGRYILCEEPTAEMRHIEQVLQEANEADYLCKKQLLKDEIKKRVEDHFASPPRMPSPEPVIHPLDQSLSEELDLPPAILPPSGWSWQTPPKYKLSDYKPREKYSPRAISPDKPFSEDVTMFYESPPREMLSPTSPSNVMHPQDFSPPSQSPISASYGIEDDHYLENILNTVCECIDEDENPELYVSPTKDKTLEQIQPEITSPTKDIPYMSLDDQIAALECECFGEKITTPIKMPKKESAAASNVSNIQYSPETPEYKRQLWKDSLKLHEFDKQQQYRKRQWVVQPKPSRKVKVPRHTRKPNLETIADEKEPSSLNVKREDIIKAEKRMQESRRIYEEAQKQAMLDILKLEELTQSSMAKKSPCYQRSSEEQKTKLKEDIARRVREQFSSPPRDIQSEPVITHPFDEELPPDLPSALLPPSGWAWKTPPRLQYQPFATQRIVSPSGVSPPQQIDPESLLYESPPQLIPEENLEETCLPCSPVETFTRSPKERLMETTPKLPTKSPMKTPITSRTLPAFSPITSPSNRAQINTTQFEDIYQEFPPEELSSLPSPPSSKEPESISDEEYNLLIDAEINAVENAMMQPVQKQYYSPCTPPTPVHSRKIWQQELALRSPLQLQKRVWVVKPTPGKSYRVRKSKKPELSPVKEKYLEWSPEVVFESPVTSPAVMSPEIQQITTTPTRQQQVPPDNWSWKTPSPQTLKTTRQRMVEEGVIPFPVQTGDLFSSPEIFSGSPPYMAQSPPETSPVNVYSPCSGVSPPQLTPEFYYSPESDSPVLSPDISPYGSPVRSPGGRPIVPEWAQGNDDDFYFSEILPDQHEYVDEEIPPEDIYAATLPPTPPPLPASPRPYLHHIKLTPRTRPKPDPSMFSPEHSPTHTPYRAYQSLNSPCRPSESYPMGRGQTPESAKRPYELLAEAVRFEPKRPTPKPSPPTEYQTPTRGQFRGSRRRRHINREAPRRRLIFEEDTNMEDDAEDIQNLQRTMETSAPTYVIRDVDAESPPRDADISVLSDFDFEPQEFNLFEDETAEEYNIRLPFEGHHYYAQEGSPIPVIDEISEEERDFRWMPCSSNCQNTPKR